MYVHVCVCVGMHVCMCVNWVLKYTHTVLVAQTHTFSNSLSLSPPFKSPYPSGVCGAPWCNYGRLGAGYGHA